MCKRLQIGFVLLILPLLSGCWDRTEINDLAIVLGTSFDQGKEKGMRYQVGVQISLPGAMGGASGGGGGTGGGGKPYYVDTANGRTIREAKSILQERMSRQLNFAHRRVVLVGEGLAKKGFSEAMDVILRTPDSRINAYILITEGDALKVLESSPHMEMFPAEAFREMAKMDIGVRVRQVLQELRSKGKDPVIPVIRGLQKGDEGERVKGEVVIERYALFKQDRLIRFTKNEETEGIRWLMKGMINRTVTFSFPGKGNLSLLITEQRMKPRIQLVNGKPELTLQLAMKAIIQDNELRHQLNKDDSYRYMQERVHRHINRMVENVWMVSQQEGLDVLGVGKLLAEHEPSYWEEVKAEWPKGLADTDLRIVVKVNIDRVGFVEESAE